MKTQNILFICLLISLSHLSQSKFLKELKTPDHYTYLDTKYPGTKYEETTPEMETENNPLLVKVNKQTTERGFTGTPKDWFNRSLDKDNNSPLRRNTDMNKSDQAYYGIYTDPEIHLNMLQDEIRTVSFANAFMRNKDLVKGAFVIDIGCGTGILSIQAAQAGAKKVLCIEASAMATNTRQIIKDNGFDNVIEVVNKRLEDLQLQPNSVDIIVSEWIDQMLFAEHMIYSVIYARDKWLKKGGLIFPDRATMYIAGIDDFENREMRFNFWDNVYGLNFSYIKQTVLQLPMVITFRRKEDIMTTINKVIDVDIYTIKKEDVDFTCAYELTAIRDGQVNSIISWFDIQFELPSRVTFSTGPFTPLTVWGLTAFYMKEDLSVKNGEVINGSFALKNNTGKDDKRGMDIKMSYHFHNGNGIDKDWVQYFKLNDF